MPLTVGTFASFGINLGAVWQRGMALSYHSMEFRHFPDVS